MQELALYLLLHVIWGMENIRSYIFFPLYINGVGKIQDLAFFLRLLRYMRIWIEMQDPFFFLLSFFFINLNSGMYTIIPIHTWFDSLLKSTSIKIQSFKESVFLCYYFRWI